MQLKLRNVFVSTLASLALTAVFALHAQGKEVEPTASSDPAELRAYLGRLAERIKQDPKPEHYGTQARIFKWLKDYKSSARSVTKLIELQPKNGQAYAFRASMYHAQKRDQLAINDLNTAEALGFRPPSLYSDRGLSKLSIKDYSGAELDANQALKLNPNDQTGWFVKGSAKCELGRTQEGLAYLERAVELNPSDAFAIHRRGAAYLVLGRNDDAKADFEKARSLGWVP